MFVNIGAAEGRIYTFRRASFLERVRRLNIGPCGSVEQNFLKFNRSSSTSSMRLLRTVTTSEADR